LPFEKFGYWLIVYLYRKIYIRKCVIQKEVEALLGRREFNFTHEIPYLLGLTTVVFFYTSGIPFLMMIFPWFLIAYFYIEKLMLLKFYKKPVNLDETALRFADYVVVLILFMHAFCSIVAFGTADVFPMDTERVHGLRRGFTTYYYKPKNISFFSKLGVPMNLGYIFLIILLLVFFLLAFLFRNKVICRKFKYFPMSYSSKVKYIPGTYERVKDN
jgi:hypothetical protein